MEKNRLTKEVFGYGSLYPLTTDFVAEVLKKMYKAEVMNLHFRISSWLKEYDSSSEESSDEHFFGYYISTTKPAKLDSPDSIVEETSPCIHAQSPNNIEVKRHPSPYYYSDIYKNTCQETLTSLSFALKQIIEKPEHNKFPKHASSYNQKYVSRRKHKKDTSIDNPSLLEPIQTRSQSYLKHNRSLASETQGSTCRDVEDVYDMSPARTISPCSCLTIDDGITDDMTRQRHVYETAFDCRISKSDDDLDEIDKVSNHPVLVHVNSSRGQNSRTPSAGITVDKHKLNVYATQLNQEDNNISTLDQNLQELHLTVEEPSSSSQKTAFPPPRRYTPSPPSTAPLPIKFPGKELTMNSIRSAPNLPSHQRCRFKDLRLPIKSLCSQSSTSSGSRCLQILPNTCVIQFKSSNQSISEIKRNPETFKDHIINKKGRVLEIKDRPRKDFLLLNTSKENTRDEILDFTKRARRHKYSSTESMTTSSSGGSMESIKSSTSEDNRSTSSSDSRESSSLSSHSSDSGQNSNFTTKQKSNHVAQAKLNILSPISDKSSQEQPSETSDNNRNNNSQKCSPEEIITPENIRMRKRLPQNRNILSLGFHSGNLEIQGSDSGISIQSREGIKSGLGYTSGQLCVPNQQDFLHLPFDMPKLRRKRLTPQNGCTSGSATSIDFCDLPFDMPKLRRRLRFQHLNMEINSSQASSSQSVLDCDLEANSFRPNMTLNLNKESLPLAGLNVNGTMTKNSEMTANLTIDVKVPLEKQSWFHGAITRVEAESVLKLLNEGSFLVRNSESTKHDYSLSLKSAKGYMHMRIQKDVLHGYFILGQFSKPFSSIPEMIHHFSINRLPIRGAEHMCLLQPVIAQLL